MSAGNGRKAAPTLVLEKIHWRRARTVDDAHGHCLECAHLEEPLPSMNAAQSLRMARV
jgi:hypothetical protein